MTITYDEDGDVLYLALGEPEGRSMYVENESGDVLRIDTATDRIVGCTVPFFWRRLQKSGAIHIPEIGDVRIDGAVLDSLRA